jgi:hypothetical protein
LKRLAPVLTVALALLAFGALTKPVNPAPTALDRYKSLFERIAAGAIDVFDGLSPALLDYLLESNLLTPAQRLVVEALRKRSV